MPGRLSIVATPIGCLEDITLRALRVLKEADLILAEDTRHTRRLCTRHAIDTPLRSFHAHSSEDKLESVLAGLIEGAHYALVSDAGTPLVSDPGEYLVARAAEAGVTVEPIPGPSAVLAALCVAGLPARRFAFEGFLARGGKERRETIERIATADSTTLLFESPHRIHATLDDLEERLGSVRRIALCRELTKLHEQVLRGTIPEVRSGLAESPKGEITIVIEAKGQEMASSEVDLAALVGEWKHEGLTRKAMVKRLQEEHGWKRNEAYQAVHETVDDNESD